MSVGAHVPFYPSTPAPPQLGGYQQQQQQQHYSYPAASSPPDNSAYIANYIKSQQQKQQQQQTTKQQQHSGVDSFYPIANPAYTGAYSHSPSSSSSSSGNSAENSLYEYEYYYVDDDEGHPNEIIVGQADKAGHVLDRLSPAGGGDDYYYYYDDHQPPQGHNVDRSTRRLQQQIMQQQQQQQQQQHLNNKAQGVSRQDGADLSWLGSLAANAIKIFSLITGRPSPGSGGSSNVDQGPDRIDTQAAAVAASEATEIDQAMGTLMAFGGKYLRELAFKAYEYIVEAPNSPIAVDKIGEAATDLDTSASSSVETKVGTTTTTPKPSGPTIPAGGSVLQLLKPQELEAIGLKAVAAGASPAQLQEAFAVAQLQGDWSKLDALIEAALGADALKKVGISVNAASPASSGASSGGGGGSVSTVSVPSGAVGPANGDGGVISSITNTISNLVGGGGTSSTGGATGTTSGTTSEVPSGLGYYAAVAEQYMDRMDFVINGDPENPDPHPMDGSMVTRFIKEFHLEKEALGLQMQVNSVISSINKFIGDEPSEKVSQAPTSSSSSTSSTSSVVGTGGVVGSILALPQAIGSMAVNAIQFISPSSPTAENKIDDGTTFSEVNNFNPLNTLTLGVLGVGAVGSVLWSMYVADLEAKKRRRIAYYRRRKRSSRDDDDENAIEQSSRMYNVVQGVLALNREIERCNHKWHKCLEQQSFDSSLNSRKYCSERRRYCVKSILH